MTIGFKTLDVGQQALVYSLEGEGRIEEGPQRLFLWREKFVHLAHYSATQNQYLRVLYKNGKVEHMHGPLTLWRNPLEHESIEVKDGVPLDANEIVVVYQREKDGNAVKRYLKHGPTMFVPQANEWLHQFCWHGTDPQSKTRKLPGTLRFSKLQVIPDQFYYNVDEVRTSDDALIRVKLMIFYELSNIEHMLSATQDPIADFINCLEADVVAFAAKLTYMEFIEKSNQLNDLSQYPQLLERCKTIGYHVGKVVYRGYFASPTLQQMHDNAIQSRMRIKIETETEEQEQEFTDINLQNEFQRHKIEQKMELEAVKHKHEMERSKVEHQLALEARKHEEKIRQQRKQHGAEMTAREARTAEDVRHLHTLGGLDVEVGRYMLSKNPRPAKIIRVVGNQASNFHLHESTV